MDTKVISALKMADLRQRGVQAPQEAGHFAGRRYDLPHLLVGQRSAPGEALEGGKEDPATSGGEDVGLRLAHDREILADSQPGIHLRQRLPTHSPTQKRCVQLEHVWRATLG